MDRQTIMTTGRKGKYKNNYGLIEFTHTKRSVMDILDNIHSAGRPFIIASKHAVIRDHKRIERNVHLLDLN